MAKVTDIKELLESNKHNAYPVLNKDKKVIGLITRSFINILIKNQAWFGESITGLQDKSLKQKELKLEQSERQEKEYIIARSTTLNRQN